MYSTFRLKNLQLKDWLDEEGEITDRSLEIIRQSEDFLESIMSERKYAAPLVLSSNDKATYVGVFILARIMLHTTRHGGIFF